VFHNFGTPFFVINEKVYLIINNLRYQRPVYSLREALTNNPNYHTPIFYLATLVSTGKQG
jgi:hypothetical protein